MKLIIFAALAALCSAEKLDRTYLPPASAKTAGGSPGSLQTPLQGDELPAGGFVNDAQGVVVDAVAGGTRTSSGAEETGLGGPRPSYGSSASKVGDAAFRESVSGFPQIPNKFSRIAPIPEHETVIGPVYGNQVFQSKTILPQASKDYNSNTLSYQNNVESHKYNYGYETDNGISVGENGVAHDGIHAQGGYSYKGNDGQNYKVTYTADKGGYRPQGSHLPTPPPIPDDIVKSIEQNAKEEAAGLHDDGSYNSQKYNAEGDYGDSNKHDDKQGQFERPGSQASGIINQNTQGGVFPAFGSGSTARPQAFNSYKPSYGSSQAGQVFPTGSTGAHGGFGSSSFGQNTQSGHTPSTQFGQLGFGSLHSSIQSAFAEASKHGAGHQAGKPQFEINQPGQGSGIPSSTPSTFTQFGSQSGQQSTVDYEFPPSREDPSENKPASPTQGSLFGKPTSTFGSSTSNFGQVGSSNLADKEYLPPVGSDKPGQGVDHQKPQFGVSGLPTFSSGVQPIGFGPQSTPGSSATATATSFGAQPSLSGLSSQVLGGFKRPSGSQSGKYTPQAGASLSPSQQSSPSGSVPFGTQPSKTQSSVPQFGSKPTGLSTVSQPASTYPSHTQIFGSVGDKKEPQPAGFLSGFDESNVAQSQGADNSYHYNQPSKPFISPLTSPQGSTLSSGQQTSQTSSQFSSFNTQSTQKEQFAGSNKPSQTFGSASPTTSSGLFKPSYNGVTQAGVSPFPAPSPTPVFPFPEKVKPTQQPFSQGSLFGQKPSTQKGQSSFGQTSSFSSVAGQNTFVGSQNTPSVPSQQYTGQLYEYNKPDQGISALTPSSTPSAIGTFSQPAQESFSQGSLTSSQFGQASSGSKPASQPQFGFTQGSQTSSPYGQKPQGFQTTQSNTQNTQSQTLFGSQSYKPFGTQFGSQGTKPQFGQTTQGTSLTQTQQTVKPFGTTSQFGVSGTKPQFGSQSSQSSFQQSTQQSTQGNKLTNVYLPPISITSTLGVQQTKPQFGLESQSSQGSSQQSIQSTQQTVGSVSQQTQGSQTQFGSQSNKPFGATSQIGVQGYKPQFGQGSKTQGTFQQTQQTVTQQGQSSQSQFGSYKPFGSTQFGTQGTKPQFGSVPQKSQESIFSQTQTTSQTAGTQQLTQGSHLGSQLSKPFGTTQFGTQEFKPQSGQVPQPSSFTQTQTTQQTVSTTQPQSSFGSQSVFGSQSNKPFGSQFGSSQTTQGSSAITQTQTQQTQPQTAYLPSKPLAPSSQFGIQETKPQFGQGPSTQGSLFQQSTQTTQQTIGSLGLVGGQPSKPFETTPQFGTQGIKPEGSTFTQTQTIQQTENTFTQPQTVQGSQTFGSQPSQPFGATTQFGSQDTKPSLTQTTQQSGSTLIQQSGQGSLFGSQPSKPFGTSQFGTQGGNTQGSSLTESTQQTGSTFTQQSGQGSLFGSQPSKPFGTSQFGPQGANTQGSSLTESTQQTGSTFTQQSGQGSLFGSQPSKPFGTSQFGTQGGNTQGSSLTESTQQTGSTFTQQSGQGALFGSQPSKPFGTSQFGTQGANTQGSSLTESTQQTGSTFTQQSGQGSLFGSQPSKPFGTSQFGTQGGNTQGSSLTESTQQTGSTFTQQSGQGSLFGSQPSKPFGTTSQFGAQGANTQGSSFTELTQQSTSTQQGSLFGSQPSKPFGTTSHYGTQGSGSQSGSTLTQQSSQGSQIFGSQGSKPFGSASQFGTQGIKPQFGQLPEVSQGSITQTQTTQQTVGSVTGSHQPGSQAQFGSQSYKPFGTSQFGAQGSKPLYGQTQTTQQSTFTQSQFNQQSSYNKFSQSKPVSSSSPALTGSAFGTQAVKTESGSGSQSTQGSTGFTSQSGSKFGQSTVGSSQVGVQPLKPFSTSHHQESKPQFGAPSKPLFGQSSTTYAPFTSDKNTQSQFGYQYNPPANAFGKYQPKPQFGSGLTGFGSSHASSSASSFQQPLKGSVFGSQPFRPFGTQIQPVKSYFGQAPTSSASAFASSSSTPSPLFGSKFTLQPLKPFGTPSTVSPTSQPIFGQPTTPVGLDVSGTQSSLTSVQDSDFDIKAFGSTVSQPSTPQPLGSKPSFGFSKPCCQSQFGHSTTTLSPSFGVSSTTPGPLSTPQDLHVQGSTLKPEEFSGSSHPQGFDEKTGYYYKK